VSQFNNDSPRPEDFPIGSPESHAAARAMIEARDRDVPRRQIILDIPRLNEKVSRTRELASGWKIRKVDSRESSFALLRPTRKRFKGSLPRRSASAPVSRNQSDPPAPLWHAIKQTYGPRAMLFRRR